MKKAIALAATLMVFAAPAMAGGGATGLAPGGRTLAGPATAKMLFQTTETFYTHPATNTDACVTVAGVKGSTVRMTLVGASNSTMDIPIGGAGTLCKEAMVRMDLTCLGAVNCLAQWRVDVN